MGKETKLIEKTIARTEVTDEQERSDAPTPQDLLTNGAGDLPAISPSTSVSQPPTNGRRGRRARRELGEVDVIATGSRGSEVGATDETSNGKANGHVRPDRESRQIARAEKRALPRAPRAEKTAATSDPNLAGEDELADGSPPATDESAAAAEALVISLSGKKPNRSARTARRARKKQDDAAAALTGTANNPALGALNRHLNMMMQQLGTAHRVIGRIAAERDALRQQLADLQGIPVEQIVVTSLGASSDQPTSAAKPHDPKPATGISRFNYFGGEDIAVMRRRRQMLVVAVLVLVLVLWWTARMDYWTMPDNLSRDSITRLPFIGEFMSYFLAGWLFFRFVRVSSKGVKWVFPSEDPRRRRR